MVGVEWKVLGDCLKTVHLYGTFAGGTVVLQGSNEDTPTNWVTLKNYNETGISFNTAALETIAENPKYIRPALSGGAPTTDVTVVISFRHDYK
uniref:Uncharacterized protein n=1 Tax=viral metagenome TaxID=1070528 RepID=A0A6M3LFR7_9ZZZZ